ncbi:DUF1284 domain-containing protein [Fodinisporobacter ferrooxydans]|uniref:DUF1284 domain-containing protein n=1 Tax=Fodinisporobacter ferrooxydans TaxID=2901836 RepID=A0ABY4CHP8_9BACL|nr:DUF1284 domain-containing protein [Alicyclobacillaceae bacterium MYW30-H2]
MFRLRGHHLLCLLGYRGMGYSREYVENMTQLHHTLRTAPETEVLLVAGADDLCEKFPEFQTCHCDDRNIHERDAAVLKRLNLQIGQKMRWEDMLQRIGNNILSKDIGTLCNTCSWRSYGVCEEGIKDIKAGKGLRIIG